jgi:hypothetical protein
VEDIFMIYDISNPLAKHIKAFDEDGNQIGYLQWVDTETMTGEQIISWVPFSTGPASTKIIDVYKIVGPDIYFRRRRSKCVVNIRKGRII